MIAVATFAVVAATAPARAEPAPLPAPTGPEPPAAPELPSPARSRLLGVDLRYRRATAFDGGVVELWLRRPLAARWWAEAGVGLQAGQRDGRRAVTLANPRLAVGLVLGPRLFATVELRLPAAAASGGDGAFARTHTALAVVEPAATGPGAAWLAAAVSPRWRAGKAFAQARLGASLVHPDGGGVDPLLHADLGGGIAVAGPVGLAATLVTTSYLLADTDGDDFVHRLTLAAQVTRPGLELTAGVAAPLDRRERERDLVELTVTSRVRF